jgi:hypothetical protein
MNYHEKAVFEVDFPSDEIIQVQSKKANDIVATQLRWLGEEALSTKERFVKQNNLYKKITADIKEHPDWE